MICCLQGKKYVKYIQNMEEEEMNSPRFPNSRSRLLQSPNTETDKLIIEWKKQRNALRW